MTHYRQHFLGLSIACLIGISACTPTVKIETPSEPITINLNIKLDADVRLKLEKTASSDIDENPGVF